MVAALAHTESLFTVLASAARQRSVRALLLQLLVCAAVGALIVFVSPPWWSLAALVGAPAAYAAWGLIVHRHESGPPTPRTVGVLSLVVAIAGITLAAAGTIGLAAALFTGHGLSPYTPCGRGATTRYCTSHPVKRTLVQLLEQPPRRSIPIP